MLIAVPPSDLPRRLGVILAGMRQVLAVRAARDRVLGAVLVLLWNRLARTLARVCAIAARYRAGTLRAPPTVPTGPRPSAPPPRDPLPRHPAWVLQRAPECAAYAENLRWLLAEPEVAAMIAAAPQLRRLLRPLWRMLQPGPPPPVLQTPRTPPDAPRRLGAGPRRHHPPDASGPAPPAANRRLPSIVVQPPLKPA